MVVATDGPEEDTLGDDDFEVFDVLPARIELTNDRHVVYVQRKEYDAQLLLGQETIAKAYVQLQKDITRCDFAFNDAKTSRIHSELPCELVRYCTQSVMALPLELLHVATAIVVAECDTPLVVRASRTSVRVHKRMKLLTACGAWREVAIAVYASLHNPVATICFTMPASGLAEEMRMMPERMMTMTPDS